MAEPNTFGTDEANVEETEETFLDKLSGPKGFNFNADLYRAFRPKGDKLEADPLPDNQLLNDIESLAREFLSGELPADTVEQIERNAAERTQRGGLSDLQGRALTARDLGLSRLDLQNRGASIGAGVAQLQTQRDSFDREYSLNVAQYNESVRQWNDRFATQMRELDLSADQVALEYLKLESLNRQFRAGIERDILIANANQELPGGQDYLDTLGTYDYDISTEIERVLNRL